MRRAASWKSGCGTGAILSELPNHISLHGLDIDRAALAQCQSLCSRRRLVQGNALQLPYSNQTFDIVYCHFLLLWVSDPCAGIARNETCGKTRARTLLRLPNRITRRALMSRVSSLPLGQWQAEALKRTRSRSRSRRTVGRSIFQGRD